MRVEIHRDALPLSYRAVVDLLAFRLSARNLLEARRGFEPPPSRYIALVSFGFLPPYEPSGNNLMMSY